MAVFTVDFRRVLDPVRKIALSDYPIFDEAHREELNTRIIDHYYMREIGFETIDIFVRMLRTRMREIMPYYNKLYLSEKLTYDIFVTQEITSSSDQRSTSASQSSSKNTGSNKSNTDSISRAVNSELPQTRLAGSENYATSAADSKSVTNVGGSSEANSSDTMNSSTSGDQKSVSRGFSGDRSQLLMSYRQTLLNIDMLVVGELDSLFMRVWDTSDERGESRYGLY